MDCHYDKDKVSSDTVTDAEGYAILDLVGDLQLGSAVSLGQVYLISSRRICLASIQGLDKVTSAILFEQLPTRD